MVVTTARVLYTIPGCCCVDAFSWFGSHSTEICADPDRNGPVTSLRYLRYRPDVWYVVKNSPRSHWWKKGCLHNPHGLGHRPWLWLALGGRPGVGTVHSSGFSWLDLAPPRDLNRESRRRRLWRVIHVHAAPDTRITRNNTSTTRVLIDVSQFCNEHLAI
jgi:hypothetical protein